MQGIALRPPVNEFAAAARAEKILVIPAGDNVARLLPPLIVGEEEIGEAIKRLDAACLRLERNSSSAVAPKLSGAAE
jgi:acetylornithine/N-succinyldiaminopimelate aminotransferase